ncbi:hypothetical protein Q1695_000236 [Nippostrongylus brasiliensis]|nr:hypothetical protein Q1695_000236 [Nippostrongylus brasiliensis]
MTSYNSNVLLVVYAQFTDELRACSLCSQLLAVQALFTVIDMERNNQIPPRFHFPERLQRRVVKESLRRVTFMKLLSIKTFVSKRLEKKKETIRKRIADGKNPANEQKKMAREHFALEKVTSSLRAMESLPNVRNFVQSIRTIHLFEHLILGHTVRSRNIYTNITPQRRAPQQQV